MKRTQLKIKKKVPGHEPSSLEEWSRIIEEENRKWKSMHEFCMELGDQIDKRQPISDKALYLINIVNELVNITRRIALGHYSSKDIAINEAEELIELRKKLESIVEKLQ